MRLNSALYAAMLLVLAANPPAAAQDTTQGTSDFQKQKMNSVKQQYIQNIQGGQKQFSVSFSSETANLGKEIFYDSSLGENGKTCGSCHSEGKNPLNDISLDNYTIVHVQYCYDHYLNTEELIEKEKLDRLMAYIASLRQKRPSFFPNMNQTDNSSATPTPTPGAIPTAPSTPSLPVSAPMTGTEESW